MSSKFRLSTHVSGQVWSLISELISDYLIYIQTRNEVTYKFYLGFVNVDSMSYIYMYGISGYRTRVRRYDFFISLHAVATL